ncbi:glutamate--tRNA ligase [Natronorarus salvus]|uniref:glutamate--tRNA ligase n=1 Tax=Natronorarus salvus TaxID=3117733 RepID=UPI002F26B153
MENDLRDRIEREAERHALYNAVKHEGEAEVGAIMGPLMGENPEFRPHGGEIPGIVGPVVARVNERTPGERRDRLEELSPELVAELEAEAAADDEERTLSDLPNVEAYDQVRMRLAPNPNGPWHLGHARMPAVIGTYKERYDGWMLCRFDDTDPETKRPDLDAYDAILDAIEYLGFEADEVLRASDRLETYYDHARELIEAGGAYTCDLPAAEFSELKNAGEPSPNRENAPERTMEEFEAMVRGEYDAGEMVLRVKTDIEHRNPALRDWVAFRMVDTPHPREEAAGYRCWPLLDFQSAIDDQLTGITHIVRGIDLQDSAKRQRFLYDYFDWEYPEVMHWGKVQVDAYDVKMSTSRIAELIEAGTLDGWDDPRAPTIASVRRRGIRGEALTEAMTELGTSTSDVDLAMSTLYAKNRELVDEGADRYFLVRDGVERTVIGGPETATPPRHPNHEERGVREIPVGPAVLVEGEDLPGHGERVWLKGLGCVRHIRDAFEFTGEGIEVVRDGDVDVVHWVPVDGSVSVTLRTPEGDDEGRAEPGFVSTEEGEVVQFERVGYARVDSHEVERSVAYFAHP